MKQQIYINIVRKTYIHKKSGSMFEHNEYHSNLHFCTSM